MTKVQSWTMIAIATAVLVVGALLATGAFTSAQSPTPTPSATGSASGGAFKSNEDAAHEGGESAVREAQEDAGIFPGGCAGGKGVIQTAAAEVLGLSEDQLRQELRAGKSLADVAQAHGMSVNDFKTALVEKAQADLQAKVQSGQITQQQYDSIAGSLQPKVDAIISTPGGGARFYRSSNPASLGSGA